MESWKYFEDFEEGFVFDFEVPALTKEEITSFARNYDPQRFHLDAVEAEKTHFGGLVESFPKTITLLSTFLQAGPKQQLRRRRSWD